LLKNGEKVSSEAEQRIDVMEPRSSSSKRVYCSYLHQCPDIGRLKESRELFFVTDITS
jgi:hypothetical protein